MASGFLVSTDDNVSDVIALAFLSVKLVNVFALIASALVVANVSNTFDVTAVAFLSTMLETVSPVSCGAIEWNSDELTPAKHFGSLIGLQPSRSLSYHPASKKHNQNSKPTQ